MNCICKSVHYSSFESFELFNGSQQNNNTCAFSSFKLELQTLRDNDINGWQHTISFIHLFIFVDKWQCHPQTEIK